MGPIIQLRPGNVSSQLPLSDALVLARRLDAAARAYQTAVWLGARADAGRRLAEVYAAQDRKTESALERAADVRQRLEELRQRAAAGPSR